ncbi:MAG TPA: hypothetical protein VHD90_03620 [Phototrophicaceae bacterium]|nr:hypothetical protein [Phototrophicaceae bacterium]
MNLELETFLNDLFGRCSPEMQSAYLTFTAIHPDGDRPTPSRHVMLNDTRRIEQVISHLLEANQQGWGAYFGVALRQHNLGRWARGGKHDLACLPALFVDIDEPEDALIHLAWFDLPASCIVHTGRGFHAYWFLETPTTDFALADRAIRGLGQHLNGDSALSVAQSMRLPMTINTKAGRDEAVCEFITYHPDRRYELEEFKPFLPKPHRRLSRLHARQSQAGDAREIAPSSLDALTAAVLQQLDGRWRSNGFIAARCPYPHEKDHPGMHFSYNAESGWGYCFGKHGKMPPATLAQLLGVAVERDSSAHIA